MTTCVTADRYRNLERRIRRLLDILVDVQQLDRVPGTSTMRHRGTRRSGPSMTPAQAIEDTRLKIAANLRIDPDRIRYGRLGRLGKLGTEDPHWLIFYRDEWREFPWHFDGPLGVTRDLVRQWWGLPVAER